MEWIVFISRVFGNWLVISLAIIYELCVLNIQVDNWTFTPEVVGQPLPLRTRKVRI